MMLRLLGEAGINQLDQAVDRRLLIAYLRHVTALTPARVREVAGKGLDHNARESLSSFAQDCVPRPFSQAMRFRNALMTRVGTNLAKEKYHGSRAARDSKYSFTGTFALKCR